MKTERRHELQTNWLADRVGEFIIVIKPYMKGLVGVLLAALVLWGTYLFLSHRAEAEEASGWNQLWNGLLGQADWQETLQTLSDSSSTRPTGEWARLILADNDLRAGNGSLFTEKSVSETQLKAALEGYKTVLQNSTDPLIREHALYGVGRAQESLCNVADAQTAYKQLREEYPKGSYSARAKERLEDLARDSTQARYNWFAKLEPPSNVFKSGPRLSPELEPFSQFTPPTSKTPPPEPKPDKGATAPKESKPSDTKTPDAKAGTKIGDKAGEKSPATHKPTDTKPADTKPADTKPTDTKPTDTKPTDTKPADTKPTSEHKSDDSTSKPADNKP